MFRKLLAAVGKSVAEKDTAGPSYAPYRHESANRIYNLLFCDDAEAFRSQDEPPSPSLETVLFAQPANPAGLQALARDNSQDGRIRYLAFSKLRGLGQSVPGKILLGVIVEVPLPGGLDVLAAYSDGSVRYINQAGSPALFESIPALQPQVRRLFEVASTVLSRIGPWGQARRPPPREGGVRLTFLVSDGLYFGEGPMAVMQKEQMAGPVIQRAAELLQSVVALATK